MRVAYSFNDNYALQAGVSILSLLEHHKELNELIIYIIDDHISEINKRKINKMVVEYGRIVEYFDLELLTRDLKYDTNFSRSSYGRLFLANVLTLDSVVYIDSDTIINGSLQELQTWNMTNILVAGVADTVNPYYKRLIGLSDENRYICSGGVILLNLKEWRELNIIQDCVDFIGKYNGNPPHNDQGVINYVCRGHIGILPARYNVMSPMFAFSVKHLKRLFLLNEYYSQEEIITAIQAPSVIHYTDEFYNRPWFTNCTHPLRAIWLEYFSFSPWKEKKLTVKKLSNNCKIQNFVYKFCPFYLYLLMVRFITWRHSIML